MFRRSGKSGLLTALMGFFGMDHKAAEKKPNGNRAASPEIQHEIQSKAQNKRLRKMDRVGGWYNG